MKQEVVVVEKTAKQAVKSETCVKNIDFFDSIMMMNLSELHLSVNCASFLQNLNEQAVKYQESSVLKTLQTSLRDSALVWFKDQLKFISLNNFKTALTKTFSSLEIKSNSIIINSSSRYHICLECTTQFSSISRLLAHAQKSCTKFITCKHCELIFSSNNKLHEHVRLHHKTSIKTLKQRFVEEGSKHVNLFVTSVSVTALASSSIISSILSTTFRSMSASARSFHFFNSMVQAQAACLSTSSSNTSTNLAASAASVALTICSELASDHKFIATSSSKVLLVRSGFDYSIISSITFRSTTTISESSHHSITMIKASVACSLTSSSTSSQISMISLQKSLKSYMIMNDLFVMFAENQFKKNLNIIHKRIRSQTFDQTQIISYFRSVDQSNSTSISSFKSSSFISNFCSTLRLYSSINRTAETSQYQHIAVDQTSNLENESKTKMQSFRQKYLVDADVIHINLDIRVETTLTRARKYKSIKSSIKSSIKLADSSKIKWLKSSSLTSSLCSTLRLCSSINQDARTSHIALDRIMSLTSSKSVKLIKSLKSVIFISSLNSTLRVSLSVNQVLATSQILIAVSSLLQALCVLIKQLVNLLDLHAFVASDIDISSSLIVS